MPKFFVPLDVAKVGSSHYRRRQCDVVAATYEEAAQEALTIAREEWADARLARTLDNAAGSLEDACKALDKVAEEKGGDLTVNDALQAMGGVLWGDE